MRSTPRFLVRPAATVVLATVLAACGGGGNRATTGPRSIEDLFDPANFAARETKVQAAIADCMRAKGWEYTPMDMAGGTFVSFGGEVDPEDRATKGYGISTGAQAAPIEASTNDDPNAEYMESLSDADRDAYQLDLFGELVDFEGEQGEGTFVVSGGGIDDAFADNAGCFAEAQRSVPQEGPDLEALGPALQELQDRIDADPSMIEANERWAACMDEAGFDFASPDEILPYLFGKMGGLPAPGDGDSGEGVSIVIGGAGLDEAELSAVQSEEIEIAIADGECADSTGHGEVRDRVRAEHEARFFDEHPELD